MLTFYFITKMKINISHSSSQLPLINKRNSDYYQFLARQNKSYAVTVHYIKKLSPFSWTFKAKCLRPSFPNVMEMMKTGPVSWCCVLCVVSGERSGRTERTRRAHGPCVEQQCCNDDEMTKPSASKKFKLNESSD